MIEAAFLSGQVVPEPLAWLLGRTRRLYRLLLLDPFVTAVHAVGARAAAVVGAAAGAARRDRDAKARSPPRRR